MSKRFLSLVVLLVLVTITLFYIALTTGVVESTEDCKFYSNYSVSQIPVKCLEYFGIK